jgi:hypothetical protein
LKGSITDFDTSSYAHEDRIQSSSFSPLAQTGHIGFEPKSISAGNGYPQTEHNGRPIQLNFAQHPGHSCPFSKTRAPHNGQEGGNKKSRIVENIFI